MIFVVSSISKTKDVSESDIGLEIKTNIDSIITSAEQSTETFKIINTPDLTIKNICEENYSAYSINNNIERVENLVLYMPNKIKGRKLYSWAKEYKMPMKITNVLYLTDPDHMYVFVNPNNENDILPIISDFPENITTETIETINYEELTTYKDKNFDSYTFVLANPSSFSNSNLPLSRKVKIKSKAVIFEFNSYNHEIGNVTFYDSNTDFWDDGEKLNYAGEAMLYGAIFSAEPDIYSCNTDKLLLKSNTMYSIYDYTTTKQKELSTKTVCILSHYPNALGIFDELLNNVEQKDLGEIYSASLNLEIINKKARKDGCPLIY